MKKKLIFISVLLLSTTFLLACFFNDGDTSKTVLNLTYNLLKSNHYEKVVFDDVLSKKIFDKYIETIDYSKRFLLVSDYKKLSKFSYKIDDQIQKEDLSFFELSYEIIVKRQAEIKNYYTEILSKPVNYNLEEVYISDFDKVEYCKNKNELQDYWRKTLKLDLLLEIDNSLSQQEKNDTITETKTFEQIEEEARKNLLKTYDDYFERLSKITKEEYFSIFINSITLSVDPHSEYYAPKNKEDFDIQMSGELEGIGATLTQKYGEIKVAEVVVGGAAWKQGELEESDVILKVAQEKGEPVSIVNMRLDDAVRLIRGKKGTIVTLSVRKIDGTLKDIKIERDRIIMEETYIRTVVVQDSNSNSRIAYLNMPSFYIDLQHSNGRKCSEDFKNELLKLKNEKVDGIIIDLRNNGGGSLQEVVTIAGFFITKGPIVQVKERSGKINQLNDNDASVLYSGNVLIMTNQFSASASEIFAAALQDYNRAVIFGTPQTLGKGTVQQVMDLNRVSRLLPSNQPLGALKLTIQKFYRINGGSTQLKGVSSDISFTTTYSYLDINEQSYDNALAWDKIPDLKYELWEPKYNMDSIKYWSNNRMKNDSAFVITDRYAKSLKVEDEQGFINLKLEKYRADRKQVKEKRKYFNKNTNKHISVKISYLADDQKLMKSDTIIKYRYDNWVKNLKKDYELQEAVKIIYDMNKF